MASSPHPRPDPDRTTPLLRLRIRTVFQQVPKALAGNEEAVHQMRVAGRRLRVALPLLARRSDGRRVRRALRLLRRLTRVAGASRDLDVAVFLLEERLKSLGAGTPERALLRRRLRAARGRSRKRLAERLMDLDIARLRRDLRRILARRSEPLFTALVRLRERRESEGGTLLQGLVSAGDRFDPVALHALRRRARRLRYAAEVNDLLRGEESEAPALFKWFQEQIGLLRDRHVLGAWLEGQAGSARERGQAALAAEAEALQVHFAEGAREVHQRFLERKPGDVAMEALAVMARTRSAA